MEVFSIIQGISVFYFDVMKKKKMECDLKLLIYVLEKDKHLKESPTKEPYKT